MEERKKWPEGPWLDAFRAAGHGPAMDGEGLPDAFFVDWSYHNGFGCSKCGYSTCKHCTLPAEIPPCGAAAAGANT